MPEYLYAFVTIIFLDITVNLYIFYQMWVERLRQNILMQNEKRYSENLENKVEERTRKLVAKTKELESFSYSISHDLRAPLRHIAGYGQIIEEDHSAQLDPEGKTYLKRIIESAQRMNQLIDDLLLLSKVSQRELTIETINASSLVKEVLGNFQKSDPNRAVALNVAEDIVVEADKNLFLILLENLVGNSWKFTSEESLTMIEFGEILENDVPTYFIKDNGVGFDQAFSDKIFLPFQRLHEDERFDGTGIGLAIVKRIIDMHSGKIWVESEIEKGTFFYFSLGKLTNTENGVSSSDASGA
jgi:light-regulated signal transduction histidine kinase (bacteriophytochrome)